MDEKLRPQPYFLDKVPHRCEDKVPHRCEDKVPHRCEDKVPHRCFSKIEKVAENGRKVKALALLFGRFSPLFQKSKKWLKMDEKLRL